MDLWFKRGIEGLAAICPFGRLGFSWRLKILDSIQGMEKLFVYGTLKDPEVRRKVIGRLVAGQAERVEGFFLSDITIDGQQFPVMLQGRGSVEGVLLKVRPDELEKIDAYEGESYWRDRVQLASGRKAWAYRR